jgi:alpha-1,2-mannosyltransferase
MIRGKSIGGRLLWVLGPALLTLAAGFYFARRSGSDYRVYTNDFNVYYFAAREILSGRDPYSMSLGASTTYLYPPLLAELMAPLAMLPLPLAAYLWFLASVVSLAAAARMCAKVASVEAPAEDAASPGQPRYILVGILSAFLLLRFALDTFDMGQVNAIVVCLSVAHVYLFARGKSAASAAALALASAIKLTPAVLVLYHIGRGRIRFASVCTALIAAVVLGSFAAMGPRARDSIELFYSRTIKNGQGFDLSYSGNQSLRGALGRILTESDEQARSSSTPTAIAASLILLLSSIFVSRSAASEIGASAPFFCCMVLISPLAWKNHYIMVLLPIAYLAHVALTPRAALDASQKRVSSVSICALVLSFLLFNLTSPKLIGLQHAEWADAHSLVTVGGLVVWAAAGYVQRNPRNRKASLSGEAAPERYRRI